MDENGHLPYLPYNMENRYCISAKFPKGHPLAALNAASKDGQSMTCPAIGEGLERDGRTREEIQHIHGGLTMENAEKSSG